MILTRRAFATATFGGLGLAALREQVDTLVVVPNERLLRLAGRSLRMSEAYALADDVLRQGVQAIGEPFRIRDPLA